MTIATGPLEHGAAAGDDRHHPRERPRLVHWWIRPLRRYRLRADERDDEEDREYLKKRCIIGSSQATRD